MIQVSGFKVSRFQVSGVRFRVAVSGFRVSGFKVSRFQVSGFRFQVSGFRVLGFMMFMIQVSGFGFNVSRFHVSGFRVQFHGFVLKCMVVFFSGRPRSIVDHFARTKEYNILFETLRGSFKEGDEEGDMSKLIRFLWP
jgi:hypothetical protein